MAGMSMGSASLYATGIGAFGEAMGAYYGAESRKSSLAFQADMSAINARLAEQSAQSALFAGQFEEQRSRLRTAQLKSTQRASMAANGIDLGEGSAVAVLTTTDYMGEVDANTIHANAVRAAWGYRTQSVNAMNQAAVTRSAAGAISSESAGATSLISSASQVSGSWYQMNKAGAFDTSAVSKSDLSAANMTSDPLGSLMKEKGW